MQVKSWTTPVALAAAVAAIVGGAVWIGDAGGSSGSPGRPAMLHLAAAGGGAVAAADTASTGSATGGGRYVLTGTLPDGNPADRALYRLRSATGDDAAKVAAALDISAAPSKVDGGWAVRDGDNRLVVRKDGGWSYGLDCAPDQPVADESVDVACGYAVSSSAVAGAEVPSPEPVEPVEPGPSDAEARAAAAPVFAALGLGDAAVTVWSGDPTSTVQAAPTVDGLTTVGWTTSVQVDATGDIQWADGWIEAATAGADYPIISAREGFQALQSRPQPMMEMCMVRKDGKPGCADLPPVEITGASLGLQLDYDGDRAVLVPAWLFDVKDSGDPIGQIAIDPSYLAPPTPVAGTDGGAATTGAADVPPETNGTQPTAR